jgi:hypothetical protein
LKAFDNKVKSVNKPFSLYTFGFGISHDANILSDLARKGNGIYYFIHQDHEITESFANCLGGLLTISAQNISVEIPSNVECISRFPKKTRDGSTSISLGDMYAGEFRDIILLATLKGSDSPNIENYEFSITYLNVFTHQFESVKFQADLDRPSTVNDVKSNYHLDKHRNRTETAQCIQDAKQCADQGQFDEAKSLLSKQILKIQESSSAEDPYCKSLLEDLVFLKGCLCDSKSYSLSGNKIINDFLISTTMQRSSATKSMKSTQVFQTEDKLKMVQKSGEYSRVSVVNTKQVDVEPSESQLQKKTSFKKFFLNKKKEAESHTIGEWLAAIHLQQYELDFIANGYDDLWLLTFLDDKDFAILKVDVLGHRLKIQSRAAELKVDAPSRSCLDVPSWLEAISLKEYCDVFVNGGFRDLFALKYLDSDHLGKLGVNKPGHVKKILLKIQDLPV